MLSTGTCQPLGSVIIVPANTHPPPPPSVITVELEELDVLELEEFVEELVELELVDAEMEGLPTVTVVVDTWVDASVVVTGRRTVVVTVMVTLLDTTVVTQTVCVLDCHVVRCRIGEVYSGGVRGCRGGNRRDIRSDSDGYAIMIVARLRRVSLACGMRGPS